MIDDKVVEKIQKLLALANSSNENEAKLASSKANELLLKYNIDLQTIKISEKAYNTEKVNSMGRRSAVSKFVWPILTKYFFIKIVRKCLGKHEFEVVFLGEKSNLKVAMYMESFLNDAFNNGWEKFKEEHNCDTKYKQSYMLGFYSGITKQLDAVRIKVEEEYGLVVVNKDPGLEQYEKQQFSKLKETKAPPISVKSQAVLDAGAKDGAKVTIKRGLESTAKPQSTVLALG